MGSSAVLGIPRAPHRAPTIWEGWMEYNEERLTPKTCLICKDETCPGAAGRICTYELEPCSTCKNRNCISNFGHDCPQDERCENCGHLSHQLWYDYMNYNDPTCDMPTMELCGECGSATCAINRPQVSTPWVEVNGWDPDPIMKVAEEIDLCWEMNTTQLTTQQVRDQAEDAWDERFIRKVEDRMRREDQFDPIDPSYRLYELRDDWEDGNLPEAFVLKQLQQHPYARRLYI